MAPYSGKYRAVVVADRAIRSARLHQQKAGAAELFVLLLRLQTLIAFALGLGLVVVFLSVGSDQTILQNLVEVFFDVVIKFVVVIVVVVVGSLALGSRLGGHVIVIVISDNVVVIGALVAIILFSTIVVVIEFGRDCFLFGLFFGDVVFSHGAFSSGRCASPHASAAAAGAYAHVGSAEMNRNSDTRHNPCEQGVR
tara:strand:- start:2433 stop:3020 length:588 start_codon:yes stop_codon:yes gene_type:complete